MKPARAFQIHLSTAVVMMLAASTILWLNASRQSRMVVDYKVATDQSFEPVIALRPNPGWPLRVTEPVYGNVDVFAPNNGVNVNVLVTLGWAPLLRTEWRPWPLAVDITVALLLIAFVGLCFEYILRRREAPKP